MKAQTIGIVCGLAVACWLGSMSTGTAALTHWQYGGVDRNWNTTGNWTAGVPGSSDNPCIGSTSGDANGIATINSPAVCSILRLAFGETTTGRLTIDGGGLTAALLYLGNDGVGVVTQNASTVTISSTLSLARKNGFSSKYVLNNGTVDVSSFTIGSGGSGLYQQTGAGTLTAVHDALFVGDSSAGRLELSAGTIRAVNAATYSFKVGVNAGKVGVVEQTGGDVIVTNTLNNVFTVIGDAGTGTYHLAGGTLTACKFHIGNSAGGDGTMVQEAGTTNHIRNIAYVGYGNPSVGRYVLNGGAWISDSLVFLGYAAGRFGTLEGYGKASFASGISLSKGFCRADGDGLDRDLDLSACASVANGINNGTSETNGWYAVDHGRLVLPRVSSAATMYWGDDGSVDLVNAVRLANFTGRGAGSVTGMLYAVNHSDVPPFAGKSTAVWKFNPAMAFTTVNVTFRYDHATAAAAGIAEADLKVYSCAGIGNPWTPVANFGVDVANNLITASNQTALAWFTVGDNKPPRGTLVVLR